MGRGHKDQPPKVAIDGAHTSTHGDARLGNTVQVPVGLEMLLYRAAKDEAFKRRLLAEREATIGASGVSLLPSERAILGAISDQALLGMIDRVLPHNPHGRSFMTKVATAVTTLAAATAAASSCNTEKESSRPKTVPVESEDRPGCWSAGVSPAEVIDGGLSDFDEPPSADSSASSAPSDSASAGSAPPGSARR